MSSFLPCYDSLNGAFCVLGGSAPEQSVISAQVQMETTGAQQETSISPEVSADPAEAAAPTLVRTKNKRSSADFAIAQAAPTDDTRRVRNGGRNSLADTAHSDDDSKDGNFEFGAGSAAAQKHANKQPRAQKAPAPSMPKSKAAEQKKSKPTSSVDSKRYDIKELCAAQRGFVLVQWDVENDSVAEPMTWLPCIYALSCKTMGNKDAVARELVNLMGKPVPSEYNGLPMRPTFSDKDKIEPSHLVLDGKDADGQWNTLMMYKVVVQRAKKSGGVHQYIHGLIPIKTLASMQGMDMGSVNEFVQAQMARIEKAGKDRKALKRVMGLSLKHDDVTVPQLDADSVLDKYIQELETMEELQLREAAGILESFARGYGHLILPSA